MSSNVSQSYPYSSESDEARSGAIAAAYEAVDGLEDQVRSESTPLGENPPAQNGAAVKWWTWVCPMCVEGRLHVAGYARDRHALYTVCDNCHSTYLR